MDQLPKKQTDPKKGEGMLEYGGEGVKRLDTFGCFLSAGSACKVMAWKSDLWHPQASPAEIFGQHHISLYLHSTGLFSNKASPVQVGRRIKECHARVQDRKPKSKVEMEDFKHRRAAVGREVRGWVLCNRAGCSWAIMYKVTTAMLESSGHLHQILLAINPTRGC